MDDADKAAEMAEFQERIARYNSRRDEPQAHAIGRCLCCDAPMTEPGRRWCDAECRDLWEADQCY